MRTAERTRGQEDLAFARRDRRFWAALIDVMLLPVLVTTAVSQLARPVSEATNTLLFLATFAASILVEAAAGGSPGKLVLGLRVRRGDGGPIGLRHAAIRRSWLAVYAIGLVPGINDTIPGVVLLGVVVLLLLSMGRDPDERGWHDRVAGTQVVPHGRWIERYTRGARTSPDSASAGQAEA